VLADKPALRRRVTLGGYSAIILLTDLIGLAASVLQVGIFRVVKV
jgi:hypothetical protein